MNAHRWLGFLFVFIFGYLLVFSVNAAGALLSADIAVVYSFIIFGFSSFFFDRINSKIFLLFYLPIVIHFGLLAFLFLSANQPVNVGLGLVLPFLFVSLNLGVIISRLVKLLLMRKAYFVSLCIFIVLTGMFFEMVRYDYLKNFIYIQVGYISYEPLNILDYTLVDENHKNVTDEYIGKIKVVQLFSLSCGSCRIQHVEVLDEVASIFKDNDGVKVIAVNSFSKDSFIDFDKFVKSRNSISTPYLFDVNKNISSNMDVELYPVVLVLNQNNQCVARINGFNEHDRDFQIKTIVRKVTGLINNK